MSAIPRQAPTELPADFGRYRLLKLLGRGGMGSVYLAHDTQLDRPVALKIPIFDGDDGSEILARFFREARAAAALHHPNICPIHDVGDCDGLPYLTMAYIEGKPLADFAAARPLLPKQSGFLVRKMALALQEAHKQNVIHRDLKPANIMIDKRGEPVIMDFGLARRTKKTDPRLTEKGKLLGTPAYMPPEQIMGEVDNMGPASDIYSLGVILYELLAGRLPFVTDDMMALLSQVLMDDPPPPSKFRPDLEPELEATCLKALAKKPKDRYASMGDFAAALFEYLRPRASNAAPTPPAAPVPKPSSEPPKKKEAAGIRVSEMGGLRSVAQLQAQLPAVRERDDTKVPRRKKRRKTAVRRVPVWAWCSAAAAVVVLLVGWIIYSAGNHGSIRIEVNPAEANAEIEINGEGGHHPGEELDLPVGTHNLTVLARRYETFREHFVIRRGQNDNLVVTLQPKPRQPKKADAVPKSGDVAPAYVLERTEAQQIRVALTADILQPNASVKAWYNYAPRPPGLPGQEVLKSAFTDSMPIEDLSDGHRPLFQSRAGDLKKTHLALTIEARLFSRRLSPLSPEQKASDPTDLKEDEIRRYTSASRSLDFAEDSFKEWLKVSGLNRAKDEGELVFARRVFLFLKGKFAVDDSATKDHRASLVAKAGKGDAGGLCGVYVSVLRANGVPARMLFGRRLAGTAHVQAEFFARGIGWVPVDVADGIPDSGAAELAHFGNDPGDFLVLHVDPDLRVNNPVAGDYTEFAMQDVWSWWQGSGSDQGRRVEQKWLLGPADADKRPSGNNEPVTEPAPPITGDDTPGVKELDDLMLRYRGKLGCSAATIALARNGVPWCSRGYGWTDRNKKVPAPPDTLMGINDRPLIAAAVRQLARNGRFDLNDRVYEVLKIPGKFVNPRDKLITVRKLLDQTTWPVVTYQTLRRLIVKVSKNSLTDFFRRELFQAQGAPPSVQIAASGSVQARNAVWNARTSPLCASAPAVCGFMHFYIWDGELRKEAVRKGRSWYSHAPGHFLLMLWQPDGIDAAVLFSGGGNVPVGQLVAELTRDLKEVIGKLKSAKAS